MKFKTNRFYYLAQKYLEKPIGNEEIKVIDMTEDFYNELEEEIKNDEIINIQVLGKTRMGKSTLAIELGREIFKMLQKYKKSEKGAKFGILNIARDQQEYSKIMRNDDIRNTVIVTDESNALEDTGENVTSERALNEVFSDVQAGRYVHRVSCSPRQIIDKNADIILEVVSVNKKQYTAHCYLYYRMMSAGYENRQLLGFVNVNTKQLVEKWTKNVKDKFLSCRTEEDREKLKEKYSNDFYIDYMIRKYNKMELITREGIMRPRILDYADIILSVVERLRTLCRLKILNRGTMRNYVKMYCRKNKIPTSIVGEELMTQEVEGILNLWKSYFELVNKIVGLDKKLKEGKIKPEGHKKEKKIYEEMRDEITNAITGQTDELRRYAEINESYNIIK